MRTLPLILAGALAAACGKWGGGAPGAPLAKTVAVVNGEPIAGDALARELRDAQAGADGAPAATGDVLRKRVLDDLVDRALLLQQARARSVAVGQDQVERAFLRLRAEYPGSHFEDLLAQQRLSQAELKARLKEQLTLERLFEQEVFPQVKVPDAEVERYYAAHGAEFQEPERVRVLQIVVASKEEAQQIRDRLRAHPQTFAEVARRSSIAPEGKGGGDLGFIGKGSGFPEVFDVCFTLPPNAISDVTPSPYGFHIFKVVEKRPAQRRTLEQARPAILDKLGRDRRTAAQDEYVAALRKRAKITIDEKALAAVTP
jgi:peptidyl-prolyl cis-trans isomerase C